MLYLLVLVSALRLRNPQKKGQESFLQRYLKKLIDFKRGVSFSYFSSAIDIYYEYDTTLKLLKDMVFQTNQRLELFRENKVDNINVYNRPNGYKNQMKRIVIFIDELAELLKIGDKEIPMSFMTA